jgi:2-Cys peroxiredoxin 5
VRAFGSCPIRAGDNIPSETLFEGDPCSRVNTKDLTCKGKTLIVGVPAAFAPECQQTQASYLEKERELKCKGIKEIIFVSVNDPFVVNAWNQTTKAAGKIKMLADPQGNFTKAIGMDIDLSEALGNIRSKRYALVVENGVVKKTIEEPDGTGVNVTLAGNVLKQL